MAKTFEDRVEEVLGALHGMAWPLLEEADKRKIVGKVVHGVDRYGDTYAAWGRALGVLPDTLTKRCHHFRRSEAIDGSRAPDPETQRKRISHAKSVLRDSGLAPSLKVALINEALGDPLIRAAVQGTLDRPVPTSRPGAFDGDSAGLNELWTGWLNQANTLLVSGARLEERTESKGARLDAHAAAGRLIYQRLTERKLDAELRQLFDEVEELR